MNIVRIVIGAVVIAVGLVAAACMAVLGLVAWFIARLFGKAGRRPVFQYSYSFNRGPSGASSAASAPSAARPLRSSSGVEAIDVEVVDVNDDEPKATERGT